MSQRTFPLLALSDLAPGQEADFFALLSAKESLTTREGKPYFKVAFRDARREVSFPVWGDAPLADDCRKTWSVGAIYKLRAVYRETSYGPQLEINRIREATDKDAADGFDPTMFLPQSRFDPAAMWNDLTALANDQITGAPLRALVLGLLEENREALARLPAATHNHHAFVGGWLEHVLSVARTCVYLADKYTAQYPDMSPPLDRDLVIAGGILHDIGKLRELEQQAQGARYTAAGNLIGHLVQGRDMVREAAAGHELRGDTLLRLEHIVLSHQRLAEWGSPKPPMTPEALLVHYADDVDAKLYMMYAALRDDASEGPVTSKRNVLMQPIYRGEPSQE